MVNKISLNPILLNGIDSIKKINNTIDIPIIDKIWCEYSLSPRNIIENNS